VPNDGAPGTSHMVTSARRIPAKTAVLQGPNPQASARLNGLETINEDDEEEVDCEVVRQHPFTNIHLNTQFVYSADPRSRKDWSYYEVEMQRFDAVEK
jgi:hypothetical protein